MSGNELAAASIASGWFIHQYMYLLRYSSTNYIHLGYKADHLLIACPFAREYWYSVLHHVGLQQFTPQPSDTEFDEWWDRSWRIIPEHQKKGFNSLVVLGAWSIWTHRNACVFDGATPSISRALSATNDERHLWEMAGARCLFSLTSPVHEE